MFERYTEAARRLLFFARYEASEFGSREIGSEHLLLGLLRGNKATTRLFTRANVSIERLRDQVVRAIVKHETFPTSVEVPFTEETKRILQRAADEADRLQSDEIDTEHLLLGMLGVEGSLAASLLSAQGLYFETVRADIVRLQNEAKPNGPAQDAEPD
jgi:ATP-dependent Clp protease ATP-binding subunit ClpC